MKRSIKTTAVLVAIIAFASMSFMAAKGVALKLNLQKGETYTVTVKSNQNIVMNVQGQTMSQGMSSEQVGTLNVTDANTVISKWESMLAKVSTMGMELVYDSKNPDKTSPMMKAQVKPYEDMLKQEAIYKYDEQGVQLSKNEEEVPVGPAQSVIRELPKDELVKGYTWEKEDTREAQGLSIKTNVTFTVKEVSKKAVIVDYVGVGNADEAKINYTGTLTFDIVKGIVVKDVNKSDISMSMSEQGIVIPIKINGTTETVVK